MLDMTTETFTEVQSAKQREQAVLSELRDLTAESGGIEGRIKAAIQSDADRSMAAARNGESPLAVEKTAPALIGHKEELSYLVPAGHERHLEARRETLRAGVQEANEALKVRKSERSEAEQLALPFIAAMEEAQRAERQAATIHGRAQDALRRLG
jgi:hypothetical protein